MSYLDEAQLEIVTVDYLRELGYEYNIHGPIIAPDLPTACRTGRVRQAAKRRSGRTMGRWYSPGGCGMRWCGSIRTCRMRPSRMPCGRPACGGQANGQPVADRQQSGVPPDADGRRGRVLAGEWYGAPRQVWLVERDLAKLDDNEFLVVNQFTMIEDLSAARLPDGQGQAGKRNRRPDFGCVFAAIAGVQALIDCAGRRKPFGDDEQTMAKLTDYVMTAEAAEILGVAQNTIRKWAAQGKLPMHRNPANGYRLFKRSDLEKFLRQVESSRTSKPKRKK